MISTAQDGTGTAQPSTTWYDKYGRVQWTQDALGYIDYTGYDNATGAVTITIVDVNLNSLPAGASAPGDLTRGAGLPTPLALTTITAVDNLGRPTGVWTPNETAAAAAQGTPLSNVPHTTYIYVNTNTESKVTVIPPTGPQQITDDDLKDGYQDTLTLANNGSGDPLSLTRDYFDTAGRVVEEDDYTNLTGVAYSLFTSQLGTINVNYNQTWYGYNTSGILSVVFDSAGNYTETNYDGLGRVIDKQLNGVVVESYQYDGGGTGDGNLTTEIVDPGDNQPPRVTVFYYDWRDRQVAADNGISVTYNTLDNLGNVTQSDVYDSASAGLNFTDPDGFTDGDATPPNASALRARTITNYDNDGNVYQTIQAGVDPTTGAVSGSLVSNTYYDADGQVIATSAPGGLWTKYTYDGAGRQTGQYVTDGAGGADGGSVANDHVLSEQQTAYDHDGNVVSTTTLDRFDTSVLGGAGPTGALTSSDMRISYVLNWYDQADRLTESVNYGTNGGAAPNPWPHPRRPAAAARSIWSPPTPTTPPGF